MRLSVILAVTCTLLGGTVCPAVAIGQTTEPGAPELPDDALPGSVEDTGGADAQVAEGGDDFYCRERRLGEWFYCDKPKAKPSEQLPALAASIPAAERLAAISKELEERKAAAILDPTPANVQSYIAFQREQLDRASSFADVWRRSIWQNPDLDYTLQRPVNALGKRAWSDQRTGERERVLSGLSKRYGVFYFYSSACAACDVFSPIMKGVADRFGMTVMAVSLDGGPSRVFQNYLVDTGQYAAMGMRGKQVPALVLYDTVTKRPMPIGYGVMAADDVMDRIFQLTNVAPGSDF